MPKRLRTAFIAALGKESVSALYSADFLLEREKYKC